MDNSKRNLIYSMLERMREEMERDSRYTSDCAVYDRACYVTAVLLLAMGDEAEKCEFAVSGKARNPVEHLATVRECLDVIGGEDDLDGYDDLVVDILEDLDSELQVKLYYDGWGLEGQCF